MQPISPDAAGELLASEFGSRRALALHHAATQRRGGFWGDRTSGVRTVVYLQDAESGSRQAFAAGEPRPAVEWLAGLDAASIALLAPAGWGGMLEEYVPQIDQGWARVRFRPESMRLPEPGAKPAVDRLGPRDAQSFAASVPAWAWRAWGDPAACLTQGRAVGLRHGKGWAACAWVLESDVQIDAVGVFTDERFRRLGLGRTVAAGLLHDIVALRQKCPMWATDEANDSSLALAEALGFTIACDEPVLSWTRPPAGR